MKPLLKMVVAAIAFAFLLVGLTSQADSKVKPKNLVKVNSGRCSLAIDPAGNPHVAYQGIDYRLYHARFDGHKWYHELVDGASDCGWGNSIAIDAQGRIHIMYGAYRGLGAQKLVHAYFNGTNWQITDLGVDVGMHTRIKLDTDGHLHVLFKGGSWTYGYAKYDGTNWQIEDTGLWWSWYPDGLALDTEGYAHVSYSVNYSGCFYATNKSGNWESTNLAPDSSAPTAIGLDNEGKPHVLIGMGGSVKYYSYDGTNWTNETVIDFSTVGDVMIDDLAMAMDANDRPHFLVAADARAGERDIEILFYAFDTGVNWSGMLVDAKNAGFHPSIAFDTNGIAYSTYCTAFVNDKYAKAKWVRIALPDLTGIWSNIMVTTTGAVFTATGTLTVINHGMERSVKTTATLWLSNDTIIDASDEMLPVMLKIKSLKPDYSTTIRVKFQHTGTLAGKQLIAVIDPNVLTYDRNMLDNLIHVLLVGN